MKKYEANNELEQILLKQGFTDTSSKNDKIKGKKCFKLSKQAQKEIYFDYINIRILNSTHIQDSRTEITLEELKLLMLYFKLESSDYKEINSLGKFDFKSTIGRFNSLQNELQKLTELDIQVPRRKKIERIVEMYKNINLGD